MMVKNMVIVHAGNIMVNNGELLVWIEISMVSHG
jgi:hypothetical protein